MPPFDDTASTGIMTAAAPSKEEKPTVPQERAALVTKLLGEVESSKKHWAPQFKKMQKCIDFAAGKHYPNQTEEDQRLRVDLIQRHLDSRTSALYARNPTVVVKRKPRMEFSLWDGSAEALQGLYQRIAPAMVEGMPLMPEDEMLLQDISEGMSRRKLLTRLSRTLELLIRDSFSAQDVPFKEQCKQLVPRVLTCGVGYIRTGYQRVMKKRPDDEAALYDVTSRLAILERLRSEIAEGEIDTYSADIEAARIVRAQVEGAAEVLAREGVVYTFPSSASIIPDKRCKSLAGFLGSHWVAQEHILDEDDIKETFGVDVKGSGATQFTLNKNNEIVKSPECKEAFYRVYEIMHKKHGVTYWVCEGYEDFLEEPTAPNAFNARFWTLRPIYFHRHEDPKNPFPKSDVELLMSPQLEINRLLEAMRQHRIAARPLYGAKKGIFDADDKKDLREHDAHAIIELNIMGDQNVEDVLQQIKKAPIDPNIYQLDPVYDAWMRVSGEQEANLGGTSNATATEASIADAARLSSLSSNADDMDEMLSGVADDTAQVHMYETSRETVQRIVGPGAVWLDFPVADIVDAVYATVRAGSSGRPNGDRVLAKLERASPMLLQLQGIKGEPLARLMIEAMGEDWDLEEFYDPKLPSITARNRAPVPGNGDPNTDPNLQGDEGGDNKKRAIEGRPGPQAALPAPITND